MKKYLSVILFALMAARSDAQSNLWEHAMNLNAAWAIQGGTTDSVDDLLAGAYFLVAPPDASSGVYTPSQWRVDGVAKPTQANLLSLSNAYAIVGDTIADSTQIRKDLKAVKASIATSIDNCTTNISDVQALVPLTNGFTAAECKAFVNALRKELIDANTEIKANGKNDQDLRKAATQALQ